MNLEHAIEAILFFKNEPLSPKRLGEILKSSEADIEAALGTLAESLKERGIRLLRVGGPASPSQGEQVMLGTAPDFGPLIETLTKEELSKDIGRAGLETLAIVCYRSPVTRSEIDYIRGVNSSFILRHLMSRGLVDRRPNPDDGRSFIYLPTLELWRYLGISRPEELPEAAAIRARLDALDEDKTDAAAI